MILNRRLFAEASVHPPLPEVASRCTVSTGQRDHELTTFAYARLPARSAAAHPLLCRAIASVRFRARSKALSRNSKPECLIRDRVALPDLGVISIANPNPIPRPMPKGTAPLCV